MYPLLCEHETKILLLSINRRIQWYIGYIDLSLIPVCTIVIKACVSFSCSMHIFTQCILIQFYGKIEFCENTVFAQWVTYNFMNYGVANQTLHCVGNSKCTAKVTTL